MQTLYTKILTLSLLALVGCQAGSCPANSAPLQTTATNQSSVQNASQLSAKALATQAVTAALVNRDPAAIEQYFSPNYIQHSTLAADGRQAVKDLVTSLKQNPNYSYQPVRVIAEGNLVLFQGRYTGFGEKPLVAFDLFRVENGKIVEHWDVVQDIPAQLPHQNGLF